MSQGMSPSSDVLWEPAQFANAIKTRVRLCADGRELDYNDKYMRPSGAWFHETKSEATLGNCCFPVLFAETDLIFKEFSHQVAYSSKMLKRNKKNAQKMVRETNRKMLNELRSAQVAAEVKRVEAHQSMKKLLGQGKDTARTVFNLFLDDQEFINEFLNSMIDEQQR